MLWSWSLGAGLDIASFDGDVHAWWPGSRNSHDLVVNSELLTYSLMAVYMTAFDTVNWDWYAAASEWMIPRHGFELWIVCRC